MIDTKHNEVTFCIYSHVGNCRKIHACFFKLNFSITLSTSLYKYYLTKIYLTKYKYKY